MAKPLDRPSVESSLLATVLATAHVGVAFLDRDLRFVRVNDALAAGNGRSVAEHLGRRIDEIWPDIPAELLGRLRELPAGHRAVAEAAVPTTVDRPPPP